MSTVIHDQVAAARRSDLVRVVARVKSGWVVLGDPQILPGYCLLLPDPVVPHLNALERDARRAFLEEMARVGDAVLAVTGAERINYEILGNVEPALHAHVFPGTLGRRRSGAALRCGSTTGQRRRLLSPRVTRSSPATSPPLSPRMKPHDSNR